MRIQVEVCQYLALYIVQPCFDIYMYVIYVCIVVPYEILYMNSKAQPVADSV